MRTLCENCEPGQAANGEWKKMAKDLNWRNLLFGCLVFISCEWKLMRVKEAKMLELDKHNPLEGRSDLITWYRAAKMLSFFFLIVTHLDAVCFSPSSITGYKVMRRKNCIHKLSGRWWFTLDSDWLLRCFLFSSSHCESRLGHIVKKWNEVIFQRHQINSALFVQERDSRGAYVTSQVVAALVGGDLKSRKKDSSADPYFISGASQWNHAILFDSISFHSIPLSATKVQRKSTLNRRRGERMKRKYNMIFSYN